MDYFVVYLEFFSIDLYIYLYKMHQYFRYLETIQDFTGDRGRVIHQDCILRYIGGICRWTMAEVAMEIYSAHQECHESPVGGGHDPRTCDDLHPTPRSGEAAARMWSHHWSGITRVQFLVQFFEPKPRVDPSGIRNIKRRDPSCCSHKAMRQ